MPILRGNSKCVVLLFAKSGIGRGKVWKAMIADSVSHLGKVATPTFFSTLAEKTRNALKRTRHWGVTASARNPGPEALLGPSAPSVVQVFLWEIRSLVQRMRFARERLSAPRQIDLDLLCQQCAVSGDRYCYENVSRCSVHIEKLRSACPWIGWADMALLVQTWSAALDRACCKLDSAKTLLSGHRALRADAITNDPVDSEWKILQENAAAGRANRTLLVQIGLAMWLLILLLRFTPDGYDGDGPVQIADGREVFDFELAAKLSQSEVTINDWLERLSAAGLVDWVTGQQGGRIYTVKGVDGRLSAEFGAFLGGSCAD